MRDLKITADNTLQMCYPPRVSEIGLCLEEKKDEADQANRCLPPVVVCHSYRHMRPGILYI